MDGDEPTQPHDMTQELIDAAVEHHVVSDDDDHNDRVTEDER